MSIAFTPNVTLTTDGGSFTSAGTAITGGSSYHLSETAAGADTTTMLLAVDVSAVKAFGLKSSKAAVITVNDDGSPTATITLAANKSLVWVAGDDQYPASNPLGAVDVASWDVTIAGADDALITFAVLTDPTP